MKIEAYKQISYCRQMAGERPGILLHVREFSFHEEVEEINEFRTRLGHVRVLDGVSADPSLAAAIAMAVPCKENKVNDIDRAALTNIIKAVLETNVRKDEKFLVCVILDSLPYIGIILDHGSYKEEPHDAFDEDVFREVAKKSSAYIPVMIVNSNIPLSTLTYVNL